MELALQNPTVLNINIAGLKCLERRGPDHMDEIVEGLSLSQNNSRSLSVKDMKVLSFCLLFVFMF